MKGERASDEFFDPTGSFMPSKAAMHASDGGFWIAIHHCNMQK